MPAEREGRVPAKRRRLWFQEDTAWREPIARAYDAVPLTKLGLPRLEQLALSRAFGIYESVGDLLRADAKIRHVRNLGRLGLERLDAAVRPLLERGAVAPQQAMDQVRQRARPMPGIDALRVESCEGLSWCDTRPEARAAIARRFTTMPLEAWSLSNRARNALHAAGLRTVAQVLTAEPEIRQVRGIGHKTLCELHARCVATLRGEDTFAHVWLAESGR